MKIVATSIPKTLEEFQLALDAAWAGGQSLGKALASQPAAPVREPVKLDEFAVEKLCQQNGVEYSLRILKVVEAAAVYTTPPGGRQSEDCLTAAPVQEPVAYAVYHRMGGSKTLHWPEQHSEDGDAKEYKLVPLYTTPPAAQRQWVGLSDELIASIKEDVEAIFCDTPASTPMIVLDIIEWYDATLSMLREKNAGKA